jgi:hypothetical protein
VAGSCRFANDPIGNRMIYVLAVSRCSSTAADHCERVATTTCMFALPRSYYEKTAWLRRTFTVAAALARVWPVRSDERRDHSSHCGATCSSGGSYLWAAGGSSVRLGKTRNTALTRRRLERRGVRRRASKGACITVTNIMFLHGKYMRRTIPLPVVKTPSDPAVSSPYNMCYSHHRAGDELHCFSPPRQPFPATGGYSDFTYTTSGGNWVVPQRDSRLPRI